MTIGENPPNRTSALRVPDPGIAVVVAGLSARYLLRMPSGCIDAVTREREDLHSVSPPGLEGAKIKGCSRTLGHGGVLCLGRQALLSSIATEAQAAV